MDIKERKLVTILLCIFISMLISGCFFVPFVVHVWTYLANLAGEKDVFLASVLVVYIAMFAFLGAALGIWLNADGLRWFKASLGCIKKMIMAVKGLVKK